MSDKPLSDYQRILAELKEGGMPHREAQAEASKRAKALKEAATSNGEEKPKDEKKPKQIGSKAQGETTKPEPKKPIGVAQTIDDNLHQECIDAIDAAIEKCDEAALESAKVVGKGGRYAMAARKMRQVRKFHVKGASQN